LGKADHPFPIIDFYIAFIEAVSVRLLAMKTSISKTILLSGLALGVAFGTMNRAAAVLVQADGISAEDDGQKVVIKHNDELIAQYIYKGERKPIVYPIIGPYGTRMTRDYPMKTGTPFEAKDHPHQQSLWFTHGEVNGISFWHVGEGSGTIVSDGKVRMQCMSEETDGEDATKVVINNTDDWLGPDGKLICQDKQQVTFRPLPEGELMIDYEITIEATEGDILFGDTKEGTMGIRSNPALRLEGEAATGKAINSEGDTGKPIWGKRAEWVDYWGTVDGNEVGFAIFDHPSNPRHPTWWHAREYGLVAANPFGVSYFENKPRGTGDMTLKKGDSVTFRYRFLFHKGDYETGKVKERYKEYSAE
jgi:hypothetical protein